MAVTQVMPRDQARYAGPVPSYIDNVVIASASAAREYDVPSGTLFVRVSADNSVYLGIETAAVPAVSVTNGTGSTRIVSGEARWFRTSQGASFFLKTAEASTVITIECYEGTFESLGA